MNWLSNEPHIERLAESHKKRHPNTTRGLLNSKEYLYWRYKKTQTLWCYGIPGSGKTIFSSLVVHNLKIEKPEIEVGIAYLSYDYYGGGGQTIPSLAVAILRQLADQCAVFPESVAALYDLRHANKLPFGLEEISPALTGVLQSFSQVFLIIDALDVFPKKTRQEVSSYLRELQTATGMKLLVTSRSTVDLKQELGDCSALEIRADEQVVKMVLNSLLETLPTFAKTDKVLRKRIKNDIADVVDGMCVHIALRLFPSPANKISRFVLVEPFLKSLQGERSKEDLENALTDFVNSKDKVQTVYARVLARIDFPGQKDYVGFEYRTPYHKLLQIRGFDMFYL